MRCTVSLRAIVRERYPTRRMNSRGSTVTSFFFVIFTISAGMCFFHVFLEDTYSFPPARICSAAITPLCNAPFMVPDQSGDVCSPLNVNFILLITETGTDKTTLSAKNSSCSVLTMTPSKSCLISITGALQITSADLAARESQELDSHHRSGSRHSDHHGWKSYRP